MAVFRLINILLSLAMAYTFQIPRINAAPSSKCRNLTMLELSALPDMNELLPNEEPPNLWDYTEPLVTKATTLENFPNPFVNPIECNRIDVQESYICDPDRILRKVEADRIDELLSMQRHNSKHHCEGLGDVPFRVGIAIINSIPEKDMTTLASELLDRWNLSHDKCEDGIVILFVKRFGKVSIKWHKGVEPYINAKVASSIYPICNNLLHTEKMSVAIEKCTSFVIKRLTGEVLPSKEMHQMLVILLIASVIGLGYVYIIITTLAELQPTPRSQSR
ncbi:hypothetical protein BEWA_031150 [Theileria equi strain WA]|uniref:Signal peptide-containing protein n=1 Tax=Theileria equi strain WA TaxID=1537102 RepID=L0AXF9_THEEQ|nr:hypothetical protein BEWA_031150 [Theileria equi strain WA]AFZ80262.1 hypothetical protein BEWA_031150 [Theileria equi strain WA]|eukprot:XP_004829928.1 hypothetical protein BEWA_031150 [Theileria equi strain WA]